MKFVFNYIGITYRNVKFEVRKKKKENKNTVVEQNVK
jgi:hypothetical protein